MPKKTEEQFFDEFASIDDEMGSWQVKQASASLDDWEKTAEKKYKAKDYWRAYTADVDSKKQKGTPDIPYTAAMGLPAASAVGGAAAGTAIGKRLLKVKKLPREALRRAGIIGAVGAGLGGALGLHAESRRRKARDKMEKKSSQLKHLQREKLAAEDFVKALAAPFKSGTTTGLHVVQRGAAGDMVPEAPTTKTGAVIESTGNASPKSFAESLQFSTAVGDSVAQASEEKKKLFEGKVKDWNERRIAQEKPADSKVEPEQVRDVSEAKTQPGE